MGFDGYTKKLLAYPLPLLNTSVLVTMCDGILRMRKNTQNGARRVNSSKKSNPEIYHIYHAYAV